MPTHYLTLPSIGFEGGNVNVHRVFADENNTGYLTVVDSGDGIHGRVSWTQGYNYFEGCTVEIYHDGVWQPCVHLGSNFWEYTEPAGPAEQAGGWGNPYRVPCWLGSWPASRVLTMCAQHSHDSEKTVAEKCNAHRQEADPAWIDEGDCETGEEWQAGNCYGECAKGTSVNAVTQAAETAAGETIVPLGGGCGSIVIGDRVTFGSDGRIYTVAAGAATECPTSLSGYFITLTEELVEAVPAGATVNIQERGTKDFSTCLKSGWKAVRAMKAWHGRKGWESGCGACDDSTTHYTKLVRSIDYSHTEDPGNDADFTYTRTRGVQVSTSTGLLSEPDGCGDTSDPEGSYTYSADSYLGKLFNGDWCDGPSFDETGATQSFGELMNEMFADALAGDGTDHYEETDAGVTTYYDVTLVAHSDTVIQGSLSITRSDDPDYEDLFEFTWTLSEPYSLEECVGEAYTLADEWDLSDDVQYPWRPAGSWLVTDGGGTRAARIPLVRTRELPGQALTVPVECGDVAACAGYSPCPYDGATIGKPLPNGLGPHYAHWDGSGTIAALEWNPGEGVPETATWWTNSWAGVGLEDLDELDEDVFPSGGWVMVYDTSPAGFGQLVIVQKWVETKDTYIGDQYLGSVNFFRPCGADDRSADYKAICGRIEIASMSLLAGTLSVTLASEASHLQTTDKIDFVSYGAAPDYAETVNNGGSKVTPDTDGYIVTRTDSTHFTMTGIGSVPTATHVKSHGAPHYKWHDALRKGDFTFCVEETTCGTPANSCEAGCLPLSSCFPAVAAVLPPDSRETFENADTMLLPEAAEVLNSYTYRVKPRIYEADPFYTGEDTAPVVESRCEPPEGAPAFPSGTAYEGCGELPAFRPVLPQPHGLRGLGDAVALVAQPVAKVIDSITSRLPKKLRTKVAQCGGCQRRKEAWNRAVPFTKPLQK